MHPLGTSGLALKKLFDQAEKPLGSDASVGSLFCVPF
jgi:hypothetical protein